MRVVTTTSAWFGPVTSQFLEIAHFFLLNARPCGGKRVLDCNC